MAGRQPVPLGAEQLLAEVGLQALLEEAEPRAGADVGAERDADAVRQVRAEGEVPAAECGVAGRAVRHRDPALPEQAQVAPGRVDVVREHRPWSQQAVLVVGRGVVGAEQRADARDLLPVLVDVRGEEGIRHVAHQGPGGRQQRVGARQREAGGDGVTVTADAVPLRGQLAALGVGAVGRGEQVLPEDAVAEHQPARDAQPYPGGLLEQGVHRTREVGPEDEGRGGTGAGEPIDEVGRDPDGVRGVGQPRLLRQRAALEPVEQGHPEPADGADLREVHVGVDEPREHQARAKVDDLVIGMVGQHDGRRAARHDHAVAHHDRCVGLGAQVRALERAVGRVEEGAAVGRHR